MKDPSHSPCSALSRLAITAAISAFAAPVSAEEPAEPFSVFVAHPNSADAARARQLANAVAALQERVAVRRGWFRLVDSAEQADIRITVFDAHAVTGEPKHVGGPAGFVSNRLSESRGRDRYSFEAVVRADGARGRISGSGDGASGLASVRDAADDFVRNLKRFARDARKTAA